MKAEADRRDKSRIGFDSNTNNKPERRRKILPEASSTRGGITYGLIHTYAQTHRASQTQIHTKMLSNTHIVMPSNAHTPKNIQML